jgi:general secretion pathway protein H
MPTSATGISTSNSIRVRARAPYSRRSRGFTLIELLIVIAIVGIFIVGAVLYLADERRDTRLDQESERIDALFDYVREQAELQTRDYGLRMNDRTYSFVVFDILGNEWRPAEEDDALREREFPPGIHPTVVVEGRTIVLDEKKRKEKDVEDYSPTVLIFSNGDLSSFELMLDNDSGDRARIFSTEQSEILLDKPGEQDDAAIAEAARGPVKRR